MAEQSSGDDAPPVFSSLPCAFQYSPSLNCIITLSNLSGIEVLDVHSCSITTRVPITNSDKGYLGCNYLDNEDKLIICSGSKIGCRTTSGEKIFLNTILEVPDIAKDTQVTIEIDIAKAGLLLYNFEQCIIAVSNSSLRSLFGEVTAELKKCYEDAVRRMKDVANPEVKWLTVCLTMDHEVLTKTFNSALLMGKQDLRGPALPVIGDVLQQLTSMQKTTYESISSEKRLMFNEVDRLQTFNSWPHMDYKWALPGPMAEAGFYHPHNTGMKGEDRAMCFTCNVCLVSWESSDQPWSEHKRHSRNCPYVTGEHTENVPLQVYTCSARPQELQRPSDKIVCMSSGESNNLIATGTEEGFIVIWSMHPTLKVHSEYQISVSAMRDRKKKATTIKDKSKENPSTKIKTESIIHNVTEGPEKSDAIIQISNEAPVPSSESGLIVKEQVPNDISGTKDIVDVESYCIIDDVSTLKKLVQVDSPVSEESSKPVDKNEPGKVDSNQKVRETQPPPASSVEENDPKATGFERKCDITGVAIMYDENCSSTYVVAGVRIESRKFRKTKVKAKLKLSLLVYKLAGKASKTGTDNAKSNTNKLENPYLPNYDFQMDSDNESYLGVDPYGDPSQLSVIDEYLMAAHKNPLANGGTQNISLMNEVKSGFDQEEIVQIDDIKTVYEDCVFHKFDIDKTYYDKDMVITDLLVVDSYLVIILKKCKEKVETNHGPIEPQKNVILVFSIQSNQQQVTGIKLVNSRTLTDNLIHDAVRVLYKNLPSYILTNLAALEQFEHDADGSKEATTSAEHKTLLLTALSDNTLSFLTVPKLAEQKLVTSLENDKWIYKIAYCNPLLSVAICDNKGYFHMQPCSMQSNQTEETVDVPDVFKHEQQLLISVKQISSGFKLQDLKLLSEMSKFEPVSQGCYVFFPVNWYFSRNGSGNSMVANPNLKRMFHLSPLELDKRPVNLTELMKESIKNDFVFRMFVMVKTTIGYLDVLVNLKSNLLETEDIHCCVYIEENTATNQSRGSNGDKEDRSKLVYGPVPFSSVLSGSKTSGHFTIMVPEMICKKSLSIIVKLKHKPVMEASSANLSSENIESSGQGTSSEEPSVVIGWSSIIKDIYVGVHQFKRMPPSSICFPGCQVIFARDETTQVQLVDQLLKFIEQNGDMREEYEIKLIMRLLLWIASVHCNTVEKDRLPLVSIVMKRISEFLKATLLYGDRTLCHSCCQLLIALKKTTANSEFKQIVLEEVWKLIPQIHNATSSAAVHWVFVLLLEFLKGEKFDGGVLKRFTEILYDIGKVYGNELSQSQRILDARYGLADSIFQPILKDPMNLKMKSGNTTKKAFTRVLETTQVSTDHLPGILEVQPLMFSCISVSEGAKTEQLRKKSSDTKSNKPQQKTIQSHLWLPTVQDSLVLNPIVENVEGMNEKPLDLMSLIEGDLPFYDMTMPLFGGLGGNTGGPLGLSSDMLTSPATATSATTMLGAAKPSTEKVHSNSHADVGLAQEESVIPLPCCLLVDKMHIFSVHYAILDFKTQVYLTDLIIPPCRALASITVSTWDDGANAEDELVLASSDEIKQNALVLSNLAYPHQLRYIKIIVVGGESCSAIIPLGQYYGYQKSGSSAPVTGSIEKLQRQFGDVFCRYALALDRVLASSEEKRKSVSSSSSKIVLNNLHKNYSLCSHLQLCLNFLNNNLTMYGIRTLLQPRNLKKESPFDHSTLSEKSFSDQQLVLTSLLKTILFYFEDVTSNSCVDLKDITSHASTVLSKEEFLLLFKKICVYGIGNIQEIATCALFKLCGECTWWEEVVIEIFQMCFAVNPVVPIHKRRLFNLLIKLMQCSKGLNTIVEKLLHLLQQQINSLLLLNSSADLSSNPVSLDWILLAITQLLDRDDINIWNFFSPWKHAPADKASASESGVTENADQESNNVVSQFEVDEAVEIKGDLFLSKSTCIPVLSTLLEFILSKLECGNADQIILSCKVCSLILTRCQGLVHMEDFISKPALMKLVSASIVSGQERTWLTHSINLLLQSIVIQKDIILKEIGVISSTLSSPSSSKTRTKKDKVTHLPPFAAKEGGALGKGTTDQLSKKFEQMKAMKESMNKKFFDATDIKNFTNEKFGDAGPIERESELLTSAPVQCNVIHPMSSGFHRILEADIISQQNSTGRHKYELSTNLKRTQKLWIPSNLQYAAEVMAMKSSTMSSILDTLLDIISNQNLHLELQCLHQLLFLLNMLDEQNIDFPEKTATKFCNTILTMLKNSPSNNNSSYKSLFKSITQLLLDISPVASSFSLQLLQVTRVNSVGKNREAFFGDDDFLKLHLMSLQRLVAMTTELKDQERMLLKELLLKIAIVKNSEDSQLVSTLDDVLKNGAFLQWNGDNGEVETTRKLLKSFSVQVMNFVKDSAQLLYAANQDSHDTKRTVFLLHNGRCRMSGKSHMTFSDMNVVLFFVAAIHEILNSQVMNDQLEGENYTAVCETFSCLFQTLGYFGRLAKIYKGDILKACSAQLMALPEKMVSYQATSKIHPLASAVVFVLTNACDNSLFLPLVIKALVQVLDLRAKDSVRKVCSNWSLVGVKQFMKNVLSKSEEARNLFMDQGGFDLICSEVIKNCQIENMSWVDTAWRSHILQEVHSSSILSLSKNALQKDKLQKDENGDVLENFAPYAKIIGPSSSPGCDVLLGNKSPLRRSRFPAWGHQFQPDINWVTLEIIFPFEINLKEVVIYMHGNYLIGAPSSVIIEVAAMTTLTTVSPTLMTGGLQSIVLHFAQSLICKRLRLKLCRPNGADQLKLNLIELFGKSIFSVDDSGAVAMGTKTLAAEPWISLLSSLLMYKDLMLNAFLDSKYFEDCLACFVKSMPFLTSSSLQQVAGLLVTKIVAFTTTDQPSNSSKIATLVMKPILEKGEFALYNPFQLNLMIKFLEDVISASTMSVQKSIYSDLLDWFHRFLHESSLDDLLVINLIQHLVSKVFQRMSAKGITLSQSEKNIALINRLKELLTNHQLRSEKSLFTSLGQLLNTLISIVSYGLTSLDEEAQEILEKIKQTDVVDKRDETTLRITMFCCSAESRNNCFTVLDGLACHIHRLLIASNRHADSLKYVENLNSILNIFCTAVSYNKNTELQKWFVTEIGQSFWEPLISFLSSSGYELAGNSLPMHQLLKKTIDLFKKILYLNPKNQDVFCKILFNVLSESNKRTKFMSGYLKYILHRLVISEETVTVNFTSRSSAYTLQHSHETQLRLSSTIGEITQTLLKYRNSAMLNSSSKSAESGDTPSGVPKTEKYPDGMSEYEYVYQIGNAAVSKRKSKSKSETKHPSKNKSGTVGSASINVDFFLPEVVSQALPLTMTIGQILHLLHATEQLKDSLTLEYTICSSKSKVSNHVVSSCLQEHPSMPSMLERFATNGGLPLLTSCDTSSPNYINLFSLILPLPGLANVFLKDRMKAELLLRLMLGVKETRTGQQIQSLLIAQDLSTLPLLALRNLLRQSSIQSEDGYGLRKIAFERGVIKFVLNNLKMLYHQTGDIKDSKSSYSAASSQSLGNTADQTYWAKGTGFGTGSTVSNWDIDKAMKRKKKEEEDIVIIFQVLTAFIRKIPNSQVEVDGERITKLTSAFQEVLSMPNVLDVITGYLRNDSVLDMSRHISLYHAVLALLRPLAYTKPTLPLLVRNKSEGSSIAELLVKLKNCVGMYNSRLKATTKTSKKEELKDDTSSTNPLVKDVKKKEQTKEKKSQQQDLQNEADLEDLSSLLADINSTTDFVLLKVEDYQRELNAKKSSSDHASMCDEKDDVQNDIRATNNTLEETSAEELYVSEMVELQFDTYELVMEKPDGTLKFNVPYHYANMVRAAAKSTDVINTARARRLAQEVASLSTSLPISYSSTVFLQCDEERLDVMKVLITGPEATPYENGCFEFDVYFPPDYPTSPMSVNLQTTGKHTVRFNPNLYNDGKVCLSILNTWHGRPEEKWNAQTSNLLQVLVSIQSLILVADPYFNEPGYERLRGTPQGTESSRDYNAKIQQACVKWAILEQIKRPSSCFKEIIHKHFLHKKDKVLAQCQNWINELKELSSKRKSILHSYESLKSHFTELKLELAKLEKTSQEEKVDEALSSEDPPTDKVFTKSGSDLPVDVPVKTPDSGNIAHSLPDVIVVSQSTENTSETAGHLTTAVNSIPDEAEDDLMK